MIIQSLQSLRGIFALMIFFHHFYYPDGGALCPPGGDCGVAFFLILSGFVMTDGYSARVMADSFSYRRFMGLRLARLWPLHLLCLGTALHLYRYGYPPAIVLNAFMLQSWVPEPVFYFSGNAVSWCLADLMFCYAIFPWLVRAISRHTRAAMAVFVILAVGLLGFGLLLCPEHLVVPLMYISPATRWLDFALGIFLWVAFRRSGFRLRGSGALQWVAVILVVVACSVYSSAPLALGSAMLWWLPLGLLIIACAAPGRTAVSRFLNLRPLVAFGNVSFSFYMIHVLAGDGLTAALTRLGIALPWVALLVLDLALCIALSFICHRYFEKPLNSRLRSLVIKITT